MPDDNHLSTRPVRTISNYNLTTTGETKETQEQVLRYTKISDGIAGGLMNFNAEDYFHSFIEKEQAEELLVEAGSFLVRQIFTHENKSKSEEDRKYYIMFVNDSELIEEVPIRYSRTHRCYYVNEFCFNQPGGLIAYHRDYRVSIKSSENKFIKKGIKKEQWEIFHEQIQRIKELGHGNFGSVFRGYYRVGMLKRIEVAVKILSSGGMEDEEAMIKEALMMRRMQYEHPNVVHFKAVACYQSPIMLVMEFCDGGSLESRLKLPEPGKEPKHPPPTEGELLHWLCGSARGLDFLHTKAGIVHRDIAVRNIVIGKENEAKVTDFGLAVRGSLRVDKLTNVPTRYLPPETLKNKTFTTFSDVWAYGITLWEAYHDAERPYLMANGEIMMDGRNIIAGKRALDVKNFRLGRGEKFDDEMWKLYSLCCHHDPKKRPTMEQISNVIALQYKVKKGWFGGKATYTVTHQPDWTAVFEEQPEIPTYEHDIDKIFEICKKEEERRVKGKKK